MRKKKNHTKVDEVSIANSLKAVLGEKKVEKEARSTGFLRRKRVLLPYALILAMITTLGQGKAQWLADILRAYNDLTKGQLRYKPFHNQLSKSTFAEWMRRILEIALSELTFQVLEPVPESKLGMFKDIRLHDGSSFAIKASLKNSYPGRFRKNSPAAIELHVTMSGYENAPDTITLAPDKEAEKHFRPDPDSLKGCLFLGDRAYQDMLYFIEIRQQDGYYIVRGTRNIRPIISKAWDERGRRLRKLEGKVINSRRLPRHNVDLEIEWKKGNDIYQGRLVVFYKPGRRNKKDYTYLHTNLDRSDFSIEDVGNLYRFRWQIELLFKEWKSDANLHRFDTGKEPIAEGLIWASILASVLKRTITHAAELSANVELSTQRVARSAQIYLRDIVKALMYPSIRKLLTCILEVFDFLSVNARRAHPKRDRIKGRLRAGLQPIATA
jgi:hypothetical protein